MAAANLNILVEQGATFSRTLTLKDADGVAINLTGKTIRGKIRKTIGGTEVASFTCTLLNQGTNPGEVTVVLSAATTAAIAVPKGVEDERVIVNYIYDIEMLNADTTVVRLLQGTAQISGEVTK